jgi:hypothetical protein
VTEQRLRMARVPEGADLIPNRMSGAPGIKIGNIFIMAGVPHITAGMLDALDRHAGGRRPLALAPDRLLGVPKARLPSCWAIPKRRMKAARSAAIPSSAKGGWGPH